MKPEQFRQLEALFDQALGLEVAARQAFIDELHDREPALAERLEAMLAADADGGEKLQRAIEPGIGHRAGPERIGPFEVLRKLGEGGMGVVYLCRRQSDDFEQLLAIKRLNAAVDSDLARQRLAIERRVLASLRHPNIAQFVDGGEDDDGTPYVAMEYVDGLPIDRYAERHALGRSARIRLFLDLCQAVQFAHRNLIVHRDIKMANVMIDANDRVKLLDFGIAKLIGDEKKGHDETLLTVAGAMTPHYASPEQVRGEAATPLSDVYSLGVVLYELLAGRKPYEIQTRRPTEIEKIICLSEPPPALPARRGRLGDLNSIVGMAMHKESARRYQSVGQLAEDLEHWLEGRPVRARPDSSAYRLRVFTRRHPFGVGTALVGAIALIGFSGAMAWQAHQLALERDRAEREARVATETSQFLIELFQASDPRETNPEGLRARDLLDRAAERLPEKIDTDPLTRAELMHVIGLAYTNLGVEQPAVALLSGALELREEALGGNSAAVADSRNRLGNALRSFGRLEAAEPLLVSALEWRQSQGQADHDLADSWNNVGLLQNDLGWSERAEGSLRRSIALHRQLDGAETTRAASPLHNLAIALRDLGRHAEAREAALQSLALKRSTEWSLSSIAVTLAVLANIERALGNLDAARTRSEESLALREEVFGRDNVRIASGLVTHARILGALDDASGAEAHFREAMSLHAQAGSQHSLASANVKLSFGRFLHEQGRTQEADELLALSLSIAELYLPPDAPQIDRYRYPLENAQGE